MMGGNSQNMADGTILKRGPERAMPYDRQWTFARMVFEEWCSMYKVAHPGQTSRIARLNGHI